MFNLEKIFGTKERGVDSERQEFLENSYLKEKYLTPDYIKEKLEDISQELKEKYPDYFNSITVVGGLANGSFMLRLKEEKPATDLDYYLVLSNTPSQNILNSISQDIRKSITEINLTPDPQLKGDNPENFLDLSNIDQHVENEDFDLLSLPFIKSIGDTKKAQEIVIRNIIQKSNKQEIWDKIRDYHDQSLSLHHGKLDDSFNEEVFSEYYPKKVEKFSLPDNPEELLK